MFLHSSIILVYLVAIVWAFSFFRKMKKKRLKIMHNFIIGFSLITCMMLLHLLDIVFPVLKNSVGFLQGSQMLLILAGLLFFRGLLRLYRLEVDF